MHQPDVRVLLRAGQNADVRHYETTLHDTGANRDTLAETYAVTLDDPDDGGRKTFFVRLLMSRTVDTESGERSWQMLGNFSGPESIPEGVLDRTQQDVIAADGSG